MPPSIAKARKALAFRRLAGLAVFVQHFIQRIR